MLLGHTHQINWWGFQVHWSNDRCTNAHAIPESLRKSCGCVALWKGKPSNYERKKPYKFDACPNKVAILGLILMVFWQAVRILGQWQILSQKGCYDYSSFKQLATIIPSWTCIYLIALRCPNLFFISNMKFSA